VIRLKFHRSLAWDDWLEVDLDRPPPTKRGPDVIDYGWNVTLYWRGQHRARWHSTKNTSRMWPGVSQGADEDCNRAVTFMLWPLGHLDIWWEPKWREAGSGMCETCKQEFRDEGYTEEQVEALSKHGYWTPNEEES